MSQLLPVTTTRFLSIGRKPSNLPNMLQLLRTHWPCLATLSLFLLSPVTLRGSVESYDAAVTTDSTGGLVPAARLTTAAVFTVTDMKAVTAAGAPS